MRKLIFAALIALVGILPMAAHAQTQAAGQTPLTAATDPNYPIWIGVGAIVGAAAWNLYSLGLPSLPIIPGVIPAGGLVLPAWNVAYSRYWAITMGVFGGWFADSIYMDW
jgi:hypothetical protein